MLRSHLVGITNRSGGDNVPDPSPATAPSASDVSSVLTALDGRLKQLYDALPPRTALVIFTGHSDPRHMAELNARKSAFETAVSLLRIDDAIHCVPGECSCDC